VEVAPGQRDAAAAEQGLGDDAPDDVVGRQAALAPAAGAGAIEDVEDGGGGEQEV
jgi:hypothetical protein